MKMPGFSAETSLYQPALIVRPDSGGFEGPVVIGESGGFGGDVYASDGCLTTCIENCSIICVLSNRPRKCYKNCILNCAISCR